MTRRRSFWGWGWEDKFPAEAARKGLAQLAAGMLGGGDYTFAAPPTLESIDLPDPRVSAPADVEDIVTTDRFERACHTYGRSYRDLYRGFCGDFAAAPDLVATPATEQDIERIMAMCERERLALVPFGGGTSVVGGVEAQLGGGMRGVVSLDMAKLAGVHEVDDVSHSARIGAGTFGPALEKALSGTGLTLRHYPQSFEFSTLGGWLATRAGGHFATVRTHIDDFTQAIRMVTPTGLWQSRRLPGSGAGPEPDRLALGSEGALGVITEAWMRLTPRPVHRARASAKFRGFDDAVAATRAIAQSGLSPANCRLLDAAEARLHQVAGDGSQVLLLAFESSVAPVDGLLGAALELARASGGVASDPKSTSNGEGSGGDSSAGWKSAFVQMPYMFNGMVSIGCVVDTFETACTWSAFGALDAAVRAAVTDVMKRECGGGLLTCRFTHVYPDGPAPYYTFIAPGPAGGHLDIWRAIKSAASDAILEHGGTATHHHAVGRLHDPWYRKERPAPFLRALAAAKRELDPVGMLNPGVLVP